MRRTGTAQDPDELFDVLRADGTPEGYAKTRAQVHSDGEWHRAIHIWIYGTGEEGAFLLFQRRSMSKDTSPGRLDATVGGHYRAGESLAETLREVDEEIGVPVDARQLRFAGVRIVSNERETGIIDREIQDVFLWRDERPLSEYRPNADELDALIRLQLERLLEAYTDEVDSIPALVLNAESGVVLATKIPASELVPRVDRYPYRVAIAARNALRGDKHISV